MKKYNYVMAIVIFILVSVFVVTNVYLFKKTDEKNMEYKVSINRIRNYLVEYEQSTGCVIEDLDSLMALSGEKYEYVIGIERINQTDNGSDTNKGKEDRAEIAAFFNEAESYEMVATDKSLYKIKYAVSYGINGCTIIFVNMAMLICIIISTGTLIYIRKRIIVPFNRLSEFPAELAKGNLNIPLKENSGKYFGKIIWGLELLRDHLEENKRKWLEMQKDKKMLLLSLSHDIKTPIGVIKLYAKALSKNLYKDEVKQKEIAENINIKAEEIDSYISEIVESSHEDFMEFEVNNGEFYIKSVMEEIDCYYREKMELTQIDFRITGGENCIVYGDSDRFVEILQNIIENAIKYGDGREIYVEYDCEDEACVITITNTGCELEKRELVHIFDSFFRGTNVRNQQGSGLGLYICRQLIRRMEGEIRAEITEDKKMRVTIVARLG